MSATCPARCGRTLPTLRASSSRFPSSNSPDCSAAGHDIGLVPLADSEFNAGKSALKGMEMAACGIPYVAQHHPEYEAFGAGILARTPTEWLSALERLLDPAERATVAANGLARAAEHDWRARGREWTEVYESLAGIGSPCGANPDRAEGARAEMRSTGLAALVVATLAACSTTGVAATTTTTSPPTTLAPTIPPTTQSRPRSG